MLMKTRCRRFAPCPVCLSFPFSRMGTARFPDYAGDGGFTAGRFRGARYHGPTRWEATGIGAANRGGYLEPKEDIPHLLEDSPLVWQRWHERPSWTEQRSFKSKTPLALMGRVLLIADRQRPASFGHSTSLSGSSTIRSHAWWHGTATHHGTNLVLSKTILKGLSPALQPIGLTA